MITKLFNNNCNKYTWQIKIPFKKNKNLTTKKKKKFP